LFLCSKLFSDTYSSIRFTRLCQFSCPNLKNKVTIFLIRALSSTARLFRNAIHRPAPAYAQRIAVLQMSGIGDLLLITPALRALHQMYPSAQLDVITYNLDHASFLFRLPYVEEGIVFPIFDLELKHFWRTSFWRSFSSTARTVRKKHYDIYISFHHPWMPQWYFLELLLAAFSGATFRIGINPDYVSNNGVFDQSAREADIGDRHYRDFYFDLIRLIGNPTMDYSMDFPIEDHERASAEAWIQEIMPGCNRIVCMHVGASTEAKRWPLENFCNLALRFVSIGCGIVLIGTQQERIHTEKIEKILPSGNCLNSAGSTDLFRMGAIIDASDLFIGNDSGPMHIAIARKKPTIGLIGPYHPRFHKYPKEEATIIRNPTPIDGYDAIAVKESDYRWEIPVDLVFSEAMKLLG